ncbi:MICOS complex subunit mic60 [Dispira parvispora]|uniref:MICOS complex subunit MIC60 n=1 Tax=Dispira parvispora TaxID=1520584 RepID=A0A9W8AQA2_9FUNG|nr:MICOS complex subunit mic60 [Dispira parvispora]
MLRCVASPLSLRSNLTAARSTRGLLRYAALSTESKAPSAAATSGSPASVSGSTVRTTANYPPRPAGTPAPTPKGKSFSKSKFLFYTVLAGGVAYSGCTLYAWFDDEFEKQFTANVPGAVRMMDAMEVRNGNFPMAVVDLSAEAYQRWNQWYTTVKNGFESKLGHNDLIFPKEASPAPGEPVTEKELPVTAVETVETLAAPGEPVLTKAGQVSTPPRLQPSNDQSVPSATTDKPVSSTEQLMDEKKKPTPDVKPQASETTVSKPQKPTVPKAKEAATKSKPATEQSPEAPHTNPMDTINLQYEIPVSDSAPPALAQLAHAIGKLVSALNQHAGGVNNQLGRQAVTAVSEKLAELENQLSELKPQDRKELEAALADQAKRFEDIFAMREKSLESAFEEREQEFHEQLAKEKRLWTKTYQSTLDNSLDEQRGFLYRQFNRLIRFRVDQERAGRLANINRVVALLKELEEVSRVNAVTLRAQAEASQINQALLAIRQIVDHSPRQQVVDLELAALQRLTRAAEVNYPASVVALGSVQSTVVDNGIQTLPELRERFDCVRTQIRHTALVPEDGGMLSHALSRALSAVMFAKRGLVPGTDAESVLARTEYYLDHGDLDSATRELNQLKGWSKKVAQDWLEACRHHLTLKQALQVVEAELMMNQFTHS